MNSRALKVYPVPEPPPERTSLAAPRTESVRIDADASWWRGDSPCPARLAIGVVGAIEALGTLPEWCSVGVEVHVPRGPRSPRPARVSLALSVRAVGPDFTEVGFELGEPQALFASGSVLFERRSPAAESRSGPNQLQA